ncbi:MAG: alpha/beta fold hydrolase [Promethearchaeota archaeon]
MPFFTSNDVDINYIDVGSGEPLVFVCGTFTKLESWNYQIKFFKEKMRVIAFDNRGTGRSSRPDYLYSMQMLVEDLKNLLEHLDLNNGVHLCGSSMGAMISEKFTLDYPVYVKTLILCAPSAYYPSNTYEQNVKVFKTLKGLELMERIEFFFPLIYSRTFKKRLEEEEELYDLIANDMNFCAQIINPPEYKDYVNQNEALKDFDVRDLLKKINQPTLILSGTRDKMSIPGEIEDIHKQIPNSILKTIPGKGHALNIEAPEETNTFIWNFLNKYLF